jgi:tRNA G18 (ribose-2'-O)-methylase SpoU
VELGAGLSAIFYRPDRSEIAETFLKDGVSIHEVDSDVLDRIADSNSPQGLLAVAEVLDAELSSISKCRRVVVID